MKTVYEKKFLTDGNRLLFQVTDKDSLSIDLYGCKADTLAELLLGIASLLTTDTNFQLDVNTLDKLADTFNNLSQDIRQRNNLSERPAS